MKILFSDRCLEYKSKGHPESPERVKNAFDFLRNKDYKFIEPEKANEEALKEVHSQKLIESVRKNDFRDPDSPNYENIYDYALLSAGGAIKAQKISEKEDFALSLMRPPGHHAGKDFLGGFCYFNNLAIAVKNSGKKTLIIDFDNHFGNGTASIFYDSPEILYFSIHLWPAYPNNGWINEIGMGEGESYTINIPIPPSTGDDIYLKIFKEFIIPLKDQFKPETVAISAGFDGHHSDPLTQLNLSTNTYYFLGKTVSDNFKRKFCCLEGGYSSSIGQCCDSFLSGISGKENPGYEERTSTDSSSIKKIEKRVSQLKEHLSARWEL